MQDNIIYVYKYYYRTEYFNNLKVVQLRQNCMNDDTVQYIWILVTQRNKQWILRYFVNTKEKTR